MTVKKKRKKLINSLVGVRNGPDRSPPPPSPSPQPPPISLLPPSGVFDAGPVRDVDEPGGCKADADKSVKRSTSVISTDSCSAGNGLDYWVEDESYNKLDTIMLNFVHQLFAIDPKSPHFQNEQNKMLTAEQQGNLTLMKFFSKVGNTSCLHKSISWNVVLLNQSTLLVQISSASFPEGSKGSFVQLLDHAEEELGCQQVIVCFPKVHAHLDVIVRTFMFLGFTLIAPNHEPTRQLRDQFKVSPAVEDGKDLMFMGYEIE